jgi:hypothetical protein
MNESEKQFSFTRAALSTGGRAKSNVLSVSYLVLQAKQRAHCAGVAHRVAPEIIIEVDENIQLLRLPFP